MLATTPAFAEPAKCVVPSPVCSVHCDELVRFTPSIGTGYEDVEEDDERDADTSTSYIRRDLMLRVQYAAAVVACSDDNPRPIALGDASERDGSTPGTRKGRPRHLAGTHENGRDLDIAYFQTGTANNHIRAICNHVRHGVDEFHCVEPPAHLDATRTALLIGAIFEDHHIRAIGVDGQAAPMLEAAIRSLCDAHRIAKDACARVHLSYETTDQHHGWFRFHHKHLHVSWTP